MNRRNLIRALPAMPFIVTGDTRPRPILIEFHGDYIAFVSFEDGSVRRVSTAAQEFYDLWDELHSYKQPADVAEKSRRMLYGETWEEVQ